MVTKELNRLTNLAINDVVPIVEHPGCRGNQGIITQIDLPNDIKVRCKDCGSTGVFVDRTVLPPPVKN
jgi:hypothetical protein